MPAKSDPDRASNRSLYRRLRRALARIGFLRSTYFLFHSIGEAMEDSSARGRAELNQEFASKEDPWNYRNSHQTERIRAEIEMIAAARGTERFHAALEVGCAEGLFTEKLAPFCDDLLAVDISPVALDRARTRLQPKPQVEFALWDMRTDAVPGMYDLIVVVHALEYVRNPLYVARIRKKLVNSLRPGGHLLIGTMKVAQIYEEAWWARFMLRSGTHINGFFAEHPDLHVVQSAEFDLGTDYHAYDLLLRKKQ